MTFLEQYVFDHGDMVMSENTSCPWKCEYEPRYDCSNVACNDCWNREIPGTNNIDISKGETKMEGKVTTRKTKAELLEEIAELKKQAERAGRYEKYDEGAAEIKAMCDSFINAGFNHDAAFQLTMKMIETVGKVGI